MVVTAEGEVVLPPWVLFFRRSCCPNAAVLLTSTGLSIVAHQPLEEGEEIVLPSQPDATSASLLLRYGQSVLHNPLDEVTFANEPETAEIDTETRRPVKIFIFGATGVVMASTIQARVQRLEAALAQARLPPPPLLPSIVCSHL